MIYPTDTGQYYRTKVNTTQACLFFEKIARQCADAKRSGLAKLIGGI